MQKEINGIRVEIYKDTSSSYYSLWNDFFSGVWEPETFVIFRDFIQEGAIVIDAGAAVGMTALIAATSAKNVRVIAIEPWRRIIPELSTNIQLNPHLKICMFPGAIGDFNGKHLFQKETSNNKLFSDIVTTSTKHEKVYAVEVATLDNIMRKFGLDRIDFFKIDIEGGEYRVLPACRDLFRRHRPTLFISLHPGFNRTYRTHSLLERLVNKFRNLIDHVRLLCGLRFYKYLYLQNKERISILTAVLGATFSKSNKYHQLVFTDLSWS